MNCKIAICLYIKDYLPSNDFEDYFYNNMEIFQKELPELLYENLLCTNFSIKEQRENLRVFLNKYCSLNYADIYNQISDAYIELLIENDKSEISKILKMQREPKESIIIDCTNLGTEKAFIQQLKKELNLSTSSGLNWLAMNDFLHDIVFPKKLIFINWNDFKKRLPTCAQELQKFLSQVNKDDCNIIGLEQ